MSKDKFELVDSTLFSTLENGGGQVNDAKFFVTVRKDGDEAEEVYAFEAVTYDGYDAWQLDHTLEPDVDENIFPLVIPEETVGPRGLVEYINSRYLTPEHPGAVDEIRQFLYGPIDEGEAAHSQAV